MELEGELVEELERELERELNGELEWELEMGAGVGPLFREQEVMASNFCGSWCQKFVCELVSMCREQVSMCKTKTMV